MQKFTKKIACHADTKGPSHSLWWCHMIFRGQKGQQMGKEKLMVRLTTKIAFLRVKGKSKVKSKVK